MKVLVVTDSHQNFKNLLKAYEDERPDVVICAGDHSTDVEELSYVMEDSKYYIVRGNCDFYDMNHKDILQFNLEGIEIFLTHGHLYGVKSTYEILKREAREKKIDLVVFGHTHINHCKNEDDMTMYNPGALKDGYYGVIEINNGEFSIINKSL